MNSETRNCQNCKKDFLIEGDDFSFYKKLGVPSPTWCPDCRLFVDLHSSTNVLYIKALVGIVKNPLYQCIILAQNFLLGV